jgi:hypothetical protein
VASYAEIHLQYAAKTILGDKRMKRLATAAVLAFASAVLAANSPSGWNVHTDRKELCQFATPPDWVADSLTHHIWSSPDNKNSIVVSAAPGLALADAKKVVEGTFPPTKVIQETPSKLWYEYHGVKPNTTNWYVGVEPKANLVCGAQMSFDPAAEPIMRQMAGTLAAK